MKRMESSNGSVTYSGYDFLKRIISTTQSYLGDELIEGVVIKNYKQTLMLGGQIYPLFTKYVREQFKERHQTEWATKTPSGGLRAFIDGFCTEARWQKAYQYLRDQSKLEISPRDIPKLVERVHLDIDEEEKENIKEYLYKQYIREIRGSAIKGLPEWYKTKLIEGIHETQEG